MSQLQGDYPGRQLCTLWHWLDCLETFLLCCTASKKARTELPWLTSIPNGLFDNLRSLQVVYLQGNPWECSCDILYLRSWLQWQQNRSPYRDVRCSSPEHLRGRIVAYLTEDEVISTCQHWYCSLALLSQLSLFILLFLQAILVIFIIIYLQKFRRMTAEARSTTRELDQQADPYVSSSIRPSNND
ncbi:platelet glycoprotein Ib beta chain isoform X1 [Sylvia atricapilla]|uniref:platelet glycoprotein Ib beta chain isoform X1 n=1 Tax=Sylvia atricapilla TaxID=48155 RepID=UPI003394C57F